MVGGGGGGSVDGDCGGFWLVSLCVLSRVTYLLVVRVVSYNWIESKFVGFGVPYMDSGCYTL